MKVLFATLTGFIVTVLSAKAQELKGTPQNEFKSLLWEITRQDMSQPSYLFGTIHLLCPEDYLWTPAMQNSLQNCAEVCFEMDMDDPSVIMEVASGMIDKSGRTLKDYFSEEEYGIVEHFVQDSLGMNMLMFHQMKPAALQMLFATRAVGCTQPVSYETNIMEAAQKQHIDVTGLEEPQEQLALFDNMPQDSLIKNLIDMARNYPKEKEEFSRMLQAYKNQDLQKLHELIETSRTAKNDLEDFLYDRNRKWIERMEGRMEQRPVFFAVGAGHLPGTKGIIQLLRDKGYTVNAVK